MVPKSNGKMKVCVDFANVNQACPKDSFLLPGESKAGARIMLISPEGHKLHSSICFGFPPSNNVAVYEATLAGLRLVKALQVKAIIVHSDFLLIVNQVKESRADNYNNDAFLKIDSSKDSNLLGRVPVEFFSKPSTTQDDNVLSTESAESWIKPIMAYLKD
ncbi:Retrovirus-related Pol polyprotein from transposon [Abeliophyllum distichum]|uniref:Retrovirus-related Pol polyprotein from transposon n=1 Tax=Abeliophyllum distichum TaxID=126358 RepID=A0ABD1PCM5_9LAMI